MCGSNCGTMQLICDMGPAPAASLSYDAHAGFLSFEIASGDAPMIVNCGTPVARSSGMAAVRPLDRRRNRR